MKNTVLDALFAQQNEALALLKEARGNSDKLIEVATHALEMHNDTLQQMDKLLEMAREATRSASQFADALVKLADNQSCSYEDKRCTTHGNYESPCPWEVANAIAYQRRQERSRFTVKLEDEGDSHE